jgi:hypothetical protein
MRQPGARILRKAENKLSEYRIALSDVLDLRKSRNVDIRDIVSVCLTLGPYRNLTTLTASALFLHPNCQILNHAGKRIYDKKQIDFLQDFNKEKLDRFLQFAIQISAKGHRGATGGSITHSHAFDSKYKMKEIIERAGVEMRKQKIKSLFWKESLLTSNTIRERLVNLGYIFKKDDRLRFLLPIRNPLDCAVSNLKSGHANLFRGLNKNSPISDVIRRILDEIFWFASLKREFPARFHYFFEHEISHSMLVDLARFLQLDLDETWIASALAAMKTHPGYDHDDSLVSFYGDYIKTEGDSFPELSRGLLAFIE